MTATDINIVFAKKGSFSPVALQAKILAFLSIRGQTIIVHVYGDVIPHNISRLFEQLPLLYCQFITMLGSKCNIHKTLHLTSDPTRVCSVFFYHFLI